MKIAIEVVIRGRKQMADFDVGRTVADFRRDPEDDILEREQEELAHQVLKGVAKRDREILIRFYLQEESQQVICQQMHLTETQFRLLKSRAKARFVELGKRRLSEGRR